MATKEKEFKDLIIDHEVEYIDIDELNFLLEINIKTKKIQPGELAFWFIDHNGLLRKVLYVELKRLIRDQKKRFGCSLIYKEKLELPLKTISYETLRPVILPTETDVYISEPIISSLEKYLIPKGYKYLVVAEDFTSDKGVSYKVGDEIITDKTTANRLIQKGLAYEIDEVSENDQLSNTF